jgi:CRISPR-associated protein Csb2
MAAVADGADKSAAEWPPHPDRLFMALVAAHFETERDAGERAALLWLEKQAPPELCVNLKVSHRTILNHYVPVNDVSTPRIGESVSDRQLAEGLQVLPESRLRQARQFPVVVPYDDCVHFIWPDADADPEIRAAISALCSKVTCLGHSASLIQVWLTSTPPAATLRARATGPLHLRVTGEGRFQQLEDAYNESQRQAWYALECAIADAEGVARKKLRDEQAARFGPAAPQLRRPSPALPLAYGLISEKPTAPVQSIFNDRVLIFRHVLRQSESTTLAPRYLSVDQIPLLMSAWRSAIMAACAEQPPPEWVSGHEVTGRPSKQPHLAVLPILNFAVANVPKSVLGVAIAFPRTVPDREVGRCLASLFKLDTHGDPHPQRVYHGKDFEIDVVFEMGASAREALRASAWTASPKGAKVWTSMTPVALDRHGKRGRFDDEVREQIKRACENLGLPRPDEVELSCNGFLACAAPANAIPVLRRKDGSARQQVHVRLRFPVEVTGPILIGAGRFRGYGVCVPISGSSP